MKDKVNRIPATDKGMVAPTSEASSQPGETDLLLNRLRDVRVGRFAERLTSEQRSVLERIEAALETYGSYFYPPEHR